MDKLTIQKIRKTNWKKWGTRRFTIRFAENFTTCTLHFPNIFALKFPEQLVLTINEIGYAYINKSQLTTFLKQWLKKLYSSSFARLYEKKAQPYLNHFLKYSKKIAQTDLSHLNQAAVTKLFNQFISKEDKFTNFLWLIFILDDFLSHELAKKLKKF